MIAVLAAIAISRSPVDRTIVRFLTAAFSNSPPSHGIPAFHRSKNNAVNGQSTHHAEATEGQGPSEGYCRASSSSREIDRPNSNKKSMDRTIDSND
jgi:hypothetical protein